MLDHEDAAAADSGSDAGSVWGEFDGGLFGSVDDLDPLTPPEPTTAPYPTGAGLATNPTVVSALDDAWHASEADHLEHGGFIYLGSDGQVFTQEAPPGTSNTEIDLSAPPQVPGATLIGTYHTHPNVGGDWNPEPSQADIENAAVRGLPGLVRTRNRDGDDAIYAYGPSYREGAHDGDNRSGYPRWDPSQGKFDELPESEVVRRVLEFCPLDEHPSSPPGGSPPPDPDPGAPSGGGAGGASASGWKVPHGGPPAGSSEGGQVSGTGVPYAEYEVGGAQRAHLGPPPGGTSVGWSLWDHIVNLATLGALSLVGKKRNGQIML